MEPYGKLSEIPSEPSTPVEPTAPVAQVLPVSQQDQTRNNNAAATRGKIATGLKLLSIAQLAVSIWIFILGVACVGVVSSSDTESCYIGSGIWIGAFAIVTSAIGIAASRLLSNRCLLVAYFVLCIVASVLTACLIIPSSIYAGEAHDHIQKYQKRINFDFSDLPYHYYDKQYYRDKLPPNRAVLGINICLAILAFLFAISAILSSTAICVIWGQTGCCTDARTQPVLPTVIYSMFSLPMSVKDHQPLLRHTSYQHNKHKSSKI